MPLPTILVEDNKTIRDNLIPALADFADVQMLAIAETATEALAALEAHRLTWRLAVVDMFLKEGTGLTVLSACRVRLPQQRTVVLTNYPTPKIRRRCLELGCDAVFDKSNDLDQFLAYCANLP